MMFRLAIVVITVGLLLGTRLAHGAQQPCATQHSFNEQNVDCKDQFCQDVCTTVSYQDPQGVTWTYCTCGTQSSSCCGLQVGLAHGGKWHIYQTTGNCDPPSCDNDGPTCVYDGLSDPTVAFCTEI